MGRRASGRQIQRPRRGGEKKGLQTSFQAEVCQEIETLIGRTAAEQMDFEAWESAARSLALRLVARALETHLNADQTDYAGTYLACSCGGQRRYVNRRSKSFQTVLGPMRLERACYHCATCGEGSCPRDRAPGMDRATLSPGVLRMVARVGAMVSFEEGSVLPGELAGIAVNTKQVERSAEVPGAEIAEDEKRDVTAMDQTPLPPTLYLGMDGTGIPIRAAELTGRCGKQPDGTSKTREVKLCTVWSAEDRDEEDRPVRDVGSVTYSAAIESAATPDASMSRSELRREFYGKRPAADSACRSAL